MGPKIAPTSLSMAQDGASEGPTCPQQGLNIVRHASVLSFFSVMSQNIVFPAVFAWFEAPDSAQDEPRWAPREPKMAQESAKMGPRGPSWSQDEPNMTPRWSKMRQHQPKQASMLRNDSFPQVFHDFRGPAGRVGGGGTAPLGLW